MKSMIDYSSALTNPVSSKTRDRNQTDSIPKESISNGSLCLALIVLNIGVVTIAVLNNAHPALILLIAISFFVAAAYRYTKHVREKRESEQNEKEKPVDAEKYTHASACIWKAESEA